MNVWDRDALCYWNDSDGGYSFFLGRQFSCAACREAGVIHIGLILAYQELDDRREKEKSARSGFLILSLRMLFVLAWRCVNGHEDPEKFAAFSILNDVKT